MKEKRDTVVFMRVRSSERERWQQLADRDDVSLSDWIRRRLNEAAKQSQ